MRHIRIKLLLVAVLFCGCDSPTEPKIDVCPRTDWIRNHGCAHLVARLELPEGPLPTHYRLSLAVFSDNPSVGPLEVASEPRVGVNELTLIRWGAPSPEAGDTSTVQILAQLLDDSRPRPAIYRMPRVAADSVSHLVRFSEVGEIPQSDTVVLRMRRPEPTGRAAEDSDQSAARHPVRR